MSAQIKAVLTIEKQKITILKELREDEIIYSVDIPHMEGMESADIPQDVKFSFDFLITSTNPEPDWPSFKGKAATIQQEDGVRYDYTDISVVSRGQVSYDGRTDASGVAPMVFRAKKRTPR